MKRLVLILVCCAGLAAPAASEAATHWPSSCRTMLCVNQHLNNLDTRQRTAGARITSLVGDVQALQARIASLEASRSNMQAKLGCIGERSIYRQYTYDYYGNLVEYLDLSSTYGQGTVGGPFGFLYDACGGSF